jgi:probable HAF family extracellular repeat protein
MPFALIRKGNSPGNSWTMVEGILTRLADHAWPAWALCVGFLAINLITAATAQSYVITDLGALGGSYSEAHGINRSGDVVGDFDPGASPWVRAFYYHDGTNSELPTLGGVYGLAYGINESAVIVGESTVIGAFSDTHAFVFSNGTISDLGTLGGSYIGGYSSGHAVNGSGQIVGESSLSMSQSGTTHAVLYDGTTKSDLGVLAGDYSSANAINSLGAIVGESAVVSGRVTNIHAFIYSNNVMTDLGTLGGGYSSARGINDSGVIVGEAETVSGGVTNLHAFVYRNRGMTDLGTFGGSSSSASAIDSAGHVIGYAYDAGGTSWAFLHDGSTMVNLMDRIPPGSGWTNLTSADAINDLGQITGSGLMTNGGYHAYLLTVINGPPSPVAILNPTFTGSTFSFLFATQMGYAYEGQFTTQISSSSNWLTFTNLTGDGSVVRVTDSTLTGGQRYYRVVAH